MRKWQNLAAPDDPGSWFDVDGMIPTNRESYTVATALESTGTTTATGAAAPIYAFYAATVDGGVYKYVITSSKIYRYDSPPTNAYTDVTGAVTVGAPHLAMFGNVIIAAMGSTYNGATGRATLAGTAGNALASLAGAPQAGSVCVQSGAVILANITGTTNGYKTSDVGDYTNWTTGEATSGTLDTIPGAILGAVSFGTAAYLFQPMGITRLSYVGGTIKWAEEVVWVGSGLGFKNAVCAGATGILYQGAQITVNGTAATPFYWFDGFNPPAQVNSLTRIEASGGATIIYSPTEDVFQVWYSGAVWYFCPASMAWGRMSDPLGDSTPPASFVPFQGISAASGLYSFPVTATCIAAETDAFREYSPGGTMASYIETTKAGSADYKTTFSRVTPRLRYRAGSGSVTLTLNLFRELHDTSAQTTRTGIAESTYGNWFDLIGGVSCDNFARFKLIFTDINAEIDDLPHGSVLTGKK